MSARFEILFHDPGHILIRSETRPQEISHIINYTGPTKEEMTCSCEHSNEGGHKDDCKHRRWLREMWALYEDLQAARKKLAEIENKDCNPKIRR